MTEWFEPEVGPWFSLLSLLSIVAFTQAWIQQGRHEALVKRIHFACMGIGGLFVAAGLVAQAAGQPAHVTWPLLLTGILVAICFAACYPAVLKGYAAAEQRKILARDM